MLKKKRNTIMNGRTNKKKCIFRKEIRNYCLTFNYILFK